MLILENIGLAYGNKKVLENLRLEIPEGQIHGLVGLNGSGKTSLLNAIFGLQNFEGKMFWKDQALQKKDVGYLEAQNFFYSYMSANEYLQLFSHKNPDFDYKAWAALFELPMGEFVENYSVGMKKKLALIGVLSQKKAFLMLDEPSNGLDLESNGILEMLLKKLKEQGVTVLITTHILELIKPVCEKIHYLADKKITASFESANFGELDKILAHELHSRKQEQLSRLF